MECTIFNTDDELLKEEPHVKAESLLEEILPFLKEYFIGEISFDGKAVFYRLPNGQQFKITAQAVRKQ